MATLIDAVLEANRTLIPGFRVTVGHSAAPVRVYLECLGGCFPIYVGGDERAAIAAVTAKADELRSSLAGAGVAGRA